MSWSHRARTHGLCSGWSPTTGQERCFRSPTLAKINESNSQGQFVNYTDGRCVAHKLAPQTIRTTCKLFFSITKWLNGADKYGQINFCRFYLPEKQGFSSVLTTKRWTTPLLYLINTTMSIHTRKPSLQGGMNTSRSSIIKAKKQKQQRVRAEEQDVTVSQIGYTSVAVWDDILVKMPTIERPYCLAPYRLCYDLEKMATLM